MSLLTQRLKRLRGSVRVSVVVSLFAGILLPALLRAGAPAWWSQRGVLVAGATVDDYAAVNQGQLRYIAKQAYEEMKVTLPGGPGRVLDAIWANPPASTDDYRAINLGQLKAVAEPFYARLEQSNYSGQPLGTSQTRPWTGIGADDFALANIGQVKSVFSFDPRLVMVVLPTTPFGLISSNLAPKGLTLTWSPPADSTGVVGYDIYLDGVKVGSSLKTSYTFLNLADATSYSFSVRTRDAAGNILGSSRAIQVLTAAYSLKN
jgi:hypothetical protein